MQQARSRMPQVGVLVRRGAAPVLAPRVAGRARDATPYAACMHVRDRRVIGSCHSTRQALVLLSYHYEKILLPLLPTALRKTSSPPASASAAAVEVRVLVG